MKSRLLIQNAFTMVEIVVATLVFALAIAGLLATIQSLNRPAVESFEEVQAAYVARQILEDLRLSIDAETWDNTNSPLKPTTNPVTATVQPETGGIIYNTSYTVEEATAEDGITPIGRWVDIKVTWQ